MKHLLKCGLAVLGSALVAWPVAGLVTEIKIAGDTIKVDEGGVSIGDGVIKLTPEGITLPGVNIGAGTGTQPKRDLAASQVFSGSDLRNSNYSGRDFSGSSFVGVDFRGSNLSNVNFTGATFQGVDFRQTNLSGAIFAKSQIQGADFRTANASGACFIGANLTGNDFRGANLNRAVFTGANRIGNNFAGVNLSTAVWEGVNSCPGAKTGSASSDVATAATKVQPKADTSEPAQANQSPSSASSSKASCRLPAGTYRYLYADDNEAYYFNDEYTIRVTDDGSRIVKKGDFKVSVLTNTYERQGKRFVFTNPLGRYSSVDGGEITYKPTGAYAAVVELAPVGFQQSDDYGTYMKRSADKVVFVPGRRLDDIVITRSDCQTLEQAALDYDTVVKNLGAQRVGDQLVVNLDAGVLFGFDSAAVSPKAQDTLAQLAFLIDKDAKGIVLVAGHTDSKGSADYNLKLSKKRADAIAEWLTAKGGIQPGIIATQGFGETSPVAENTMADGSDNPQGRAKNRRVEISFDVAK